MHRNWQMAKTVACKLHRKFVATSPPPVFFLSSEALRLNLEKGILGVSRHPSPHHAALTGPGLVVKTVACKICRKFVATSPPPVFFLSSEALSFYSLTTLKRFLLLCASSPPAPVLNM
jgi:hypothetical protein